MITASRWIEAGVDGKYPSGFGPDDYFDARGIQSHGPLYSHTPSGQLQVIAAVVEDPRPAIIMGRASKGIDWFFPAMRDITIMAIAGPDFTVLAFDDDNVFRPITDIRDGQAQALRCPLIIDATPSDIQLPQPSFAVARFQKGCRPVLLERGIESEEEAWKRAILCSRTP